MAVENTTNLEAWQVQQLLIDIEEAGGRQAADFLTICNRNCRIFGEKGSALRRAFQKKLDGFKRRSAEKYLRLVLSKKVNPSAATLQEANSKCHDVVVLVPFLLLASLTQFTVTNFADLSFTESDMDEDDWSTGSSTPIDTQVSTPSPKVQTRSASSSAKKKASKHSASKHTAVPPSAVPTTVTTPSSTFDSSFQDLRIDDLGSDDKSPSRFDKMEPAFQNGTEDYPWQIKVVPERPEQCREFFIQRIAHKKIPEDNTTRNVWEMKTIVQNAQDVDLYQASIPMRHYDSESRNLVLVKAPSVCRWFLNSVEFNNDSEESCQTTKDQRNATIKSIKDDPNRLLVFFL
jgi:hypothetical protein